MAKQSITKKKEKIDFLLHISFCFLFIFHQYNLYFLLNQLALYNLSTYINFAPFHEEKNRKADLILEILHQRDMTYILESDKDIKI